MGRKRARGAGRRHEPDPSEESPVSPVPDGETLVKKLLAEFGPSLDETLIRAMASDRDICTEYSLVRQDLIPLADSAFAEEQTGFDPSGLSSTYPVQASPTDPRPPFESTRSEVLGRDEGRHENESDDEGITLTSNADHSFSAPPTLGSTEHEASAASDDSAQCSVEYGFRTAQDNHDVPFTAGDQDQLTQDEKIGHLLEIFGDFKVHTINFILKESGSDLGKAFDTLLTRQQLQEEGELGKGIDGFFIPDEDAARVRGTGRDRRRKPRARGKEKVMQIEYGVKSPFLDDTKLEGADSPPTEGSLRVSPGYGRTRVARAHGASAQDSRLQPLSYCSPRSGMERSKGQYDRHDFHSMTGLGSTSSSSYVVAKSGHSPSPSMDTTSQAWQLVRNKKKPASYSADDADAGQAANPLPPGTLPHNHDADDYVDVRSHLRTAGDLARKGGYYRAAALVYTARAHNGLQTMSSKISVAAERHVAATSRPDWIDLHGVSVMDGVRIAKQRVQAWWDSKDDVSRERARAGKLGHGFTVVTGVGIHSTGGVSRLRQAVGAALRSEGWRMDTLTGQFVVTARE